MNLQLGSRRWHLYLRLFRWGVYWHVRTRMTWRHGKTEVFKQQGLRVSTRRQAQRKPWLQRRYVTTVRLHISLWSTRNGKQRKPYAFGVQVYFGGGGKLG